jgi:hypothetical protein
VVLVGTGEAVAVGRGVLIDVAGAGLHAETRLRNIITIKDIFIFLLFLYNFGRSPM